MAPLATRRWPLPIVWNGKSWRPNAAKISKSTNPTKLKWESNFLMNTVGVTRPGLHGYPSLKRRKRFLFGLPKKAALQMLESIHSIFGKHVCFCSAKPGLSCCTTVDGRNSARLRQFTRLLTGFFTSQMVQDFFHQQYVSWLALGWFFFDHQGSSEIFSGLFEGIATTWGRGSW